MLVIYRSSASGRSEYTALNRTNFDGVTLRALPIRSRQEETRWPHQRMSRHGASRMESRTVSSQRNANRLKSTAADIPTDAQGLVEFACECASADCERSLRVPLDVYRRMVAADQYLLQAGHHAFTNYRTILSAGLMRIEERA